MANRLIVALACLPLFAACDPGANADDKSTSNHLGESIATTVNGSPIYESVYRLYAMNRTQTDADQLNEEQRAAVLDELTQIYLLATEAESRSLDEERKIAAEMELARVNTLAQNLINRWRENNPVSEADLREAYEKSLTEFATTEYKARHILVETEDEAKAVIADLAGGADFAELAMERSTGPTGPKGGDLGWFNASTMVKPFGDAVRTMEKGSTSAEPVQTRFGYHVIALEDSREVEPPGLDEVRPQITNRVESERFQTFVDDLKAKGTMTEPEPTPEG